MRLEADKGPIAPSTMRNTAADAQTDRDESRARPHHPWLPAGIMQWDRGIPVHIISARTRLLRTRTHGGCPSAAAPIADVAICGSRGSDLKNACTAVLMQTRRKQQKAGGGHPMRVVMRPPHASSEQQPLRGGSRHSSTIGLTVQAAAVLSTSLPCLPRVPGPLQLQPRRGALMRQQDESFP